MIEKPLFSLDQFSLSGKHALITGASRGLGRAIAVGLAQAGAQVTISARSLAALEQTKQILSALGHHPKCISIDQSKPEDIDAALSSAALRDLGGVDILVNNAGVEQLSPATDVTPALWDRILDTNLKGAFFTAQAVAKGMIERGNGAIINMCSLTSYVGVATAVPYSSSKSGLLGMTRALSTEWAPLGLRVNAIAPGYFHTDMTDTFYKDHKWSEKMLNNIPQARFGQENDVIGAIVFLASPAASYITGQCLGIDGGYLAAI